MNVFLRTAIAITAMILIFSLVANFIASFGAFPFADEAGIQLGETTDVLSAITGLNDPNMNALFIGATGLTFIGAVALCYLTKNIVPLGIHIFGVIFWTSWIRMSSILSYGGYIPLELLGIFTIGVMIVFIAAIIGMLAP